MSLLGWLAFVHPPHFEKHPHGTSGQVTGYVVRFNGTRLYGAQAWLVVRQLLAGVELKSERLGLCAGWLAGCLAGCLAGWLAG